MDPIIFEVRSNVEIPTSRILPEVPIRTGIVINIPEYRLYFFPTRGHDKVVTFLIGVGDEGKDTPLGTFRVVEKIVHPAWYVPESIRKEKPGFPG